MSNSTSSSNKSIELNGRSYRYGDLYDSWNIHQQAHYDGTSDIDVYAPIPQADGKPLPSLAEQWREDFKKRYRNGKNASNR